MLSTSSASFTRLAFLVVAGAVSTLGGRPAAAQSRKAQEWQAACKGGSGKDCYEYARALIKGKEQLNRDSVEARKVMGLACDQAWPVACQELGETLLELSPPDSASALIRLGQGCDLDPTGRSGQTAGLIGGRRRCQGATDLLIRRSPVTRPDSVLAKRVTKSACEKGRIESACVLLAGGWQRFPDSIPLPDSLKQVLAAAVDRKRLADSARVADSVRSAREASRPNTASPGPDPRKKTDKPASPRPDQVALRGSMKAGCDAGDAGSCVRLAGMMRRGDGGARDPEKAKVLETRACELDSKTCKHP